MIYLTDYDVSCLYDEFLHPVKLKIMIGDFHRNVNTF